MNKTYYTNKNFFYKTIACASKFTDTRETEGTVCVGIDADSGTALLFWELGADWNSFEDNERHNAEWVEGWMPVAIREAVETALEQSDDYEDDLAWFLDWADDAENAIDDKTNGSYVVRDRQAGNKIDSFNSYEEAVQAVKEYEQEDRNNGDFETDFYEIVEPVFEPVSNDDIEPGM